MHNILASVSSSTKQTNKYIPPIPPSDFVRWKSSCRHVKEGVAKQEQT